MLFLRLDILLVLLKKDDYKWPLLVCIKVKSAYEPSGPFLFAWPAAKSRGSLENLLNSSKLSRVFASPCVKHAIISVFVSLSIRNYQ